MTLRLNEAAALARAIHPTPSAQPPVVRYGVVQSVQASSITITLGGSTTSIAGVKCLESYAPATSDNVVLLQTATDLLAIGVVGAPASSVADLSETYTMPSGALAVTYDRRASPDNDMSGITGGTLRLTAVVLKAGVVVNSVSWLSGGTAGATLTHQWFCLTDSARLVLGKTADATNAAWAARTVKTLALTAPYTTTYEGLHYIGVLVTGTTVPSTLGRLAAGTGVVYALPPILTGLSTAGLTTPASLGASAAAITADNGYPFAYVS